MARKATIKLRQDTYENFKADASGDGILRGEAVYLTDKKALVIGDGVNGVAGHPTLRPVANYHNTEVDGWTVTKDNNDIERKFWKDDFSVDSSSQYTGDVASFTWDTANSRTTSASSTLKTLTKLLTVQHHKFRWVTQFENSVSGTNARRHFNFGKVSQAARFVIYQHAGSNEIIYYSMVVGTYNSGNYELSVPDAAVWSNTIHVFDIVINTPTSISVYIDGVLLRTFTSTVSLDMDSSSIGFTCENPNATDCHLYEMTALPSISYADNFSSDTTERYQAVTGTVAYDNTNKRMNVTTTSGANGKATGRLKSYKFYEGSQIYDVLLPTGADGDFICLVTHSANGLMTDGIGVGLQSDGAGNWNLVTLSGTTVTEGADSGLDDADVARIEIEKDLSGAYWYYIYDAAGAKPTTATGKLFTKLSEGYTGWYAKGNSKTYAIENISIRAESIVGRTNVEVTEPFWFRDDFGENSLGRWAGDVVHFSVTGGVLQTQSSDRTIYLPVAKLKDIDMTFDWTTTADGDGYTRCSVIVGHNGSTFYRAYFRGDTRSYSVFNRSAVSITDGTWTTPIVSGETYALRVVTTGTSCSVYIEEELIVTFTLDVEYGYVGLRSGYSTTAPLNINQFDNLQISGTRVYQKPIHRGAMLETYHDGTQEVVGTTFIDDFNWDRIAETSYHYGFEVDTINGCLKNTSTAAYWIYRGVQFCGKNSPFVIGFDISFANVTGGGDRTSIGFATGASATFGYNQTLGIYAHGYYTIGAGSVTGPYPMMAGVTYRHLYVCDGIRSYLYRDGVLLFSSTDLFTEIAGFLGIAHYEMGSSRTPIISNLFVIAASPDATNGIAATIPPIGGGARYGVQEGASIEFTNKALRGDYDFTTCVKTTVTGETPYYEMFFKNTTDDSAIAADSTTLKNVEPLLATYTDFEQALNLKYADRDDTISVQVRRHTSAPDEVNTSAYIDFMAVVPTKEVI